MTRNATDTGRGKADDENRVANPPTRHEHQRFSDHQEDNDVDAMSQDSFPASDPPSTGGATPGAPTEKRPSVDELIKRQKTQHKVSETRPHKPANAGDKSVEELAKKAWAGVDADGETG